MTQWIGQLFTSLAQPFKWWIVIASWEGALRIRLGKVTSELGPGIHLRVPLLDRIYVQSLRLRSIFGAGQTMTTKDGQVISVAVALEYGVKSLLQVYETLANPEAVLLFRVQGLISQHISQASSDALTPQSIQAAVNAELPFTDWGMDRLKVHVVTFAFVKTYRLLMNEYPNYTGLNGMEDDHKAVR